MKNFSGFTIVETLVVLALMGVFTVFLILGLRNTSINTVVLERAALGIISDVRRAQGMSIAGVGFQGNPMCGYGIHYTGASTYIVYAGGENICAASNKNYQSDSDLIYQQAKITETNVEFKSSFNDLFFAPPDPKTYINNSFSLSAPPLTISIGFKGLSCPAYCKTISVYPSGKVDIN